MEAYYGLWQKCNNIHTRHLNIIVVVWQLPSGLPKQKVGEMTGKVNSDS